MSSKGSAIRNRTQLHLCSTFILVHLIIAQVSGLSQSCFEQEAQQLHLRFPVLKQLGIPPLFTWYSLARRQATV